LKGGKFLPFSPKGESIPKIRGREEATKKVGGERGFSLLSSLREKGKEKE